MTTVPARPGGPDQSDRAERVLDAAALLLLRWGYQRITMEDIAREASIGTGTLYLHWTTKAALFETVLLRELLALWLALEQALDADPTTALLHRLLGTLLRTIDRRPLARALFVRDTALLGVLADNDTVRQRQPLAQATDLIQLFRDLGLMHREAAVVVQAHAFSAIWTGFVLVESVRRSDDCPAIDTQVAALSDTVRRTFEPAVLPPPESLRDHAAPALRAMLGQARLAIEQQIGARMRVPAAAVSRPRRMAAR